MTLRFDNLLEGHTELRKDVILMVTVQYRERLEIEIGQGDRCMEWGPEEARRSQACTSSGPHPGESSGQHVLSPA